MFSSISMVTRALCTFFASSSSSLRGSFAKTNCLGVNGSQFATASASKNGKFRIAIHRALVVFEGKFQISITSTPNSHLEF